MRYNKFNAAVYEFTEFLIRLRPDLRKNVWISRTRMYCRDDWCEFRTQLVLKEIDDDVENLHEHWDTEEAKTFRPKIQGIYFFEDNHNEPLGGVMGYSYELYEDKNEKATDQSQ